MGLIFVVASETVEWSVWPGIDFFPYNDYDTDWWTGYYTSRNALKGFARSRENIQRTSELVHSLSQAPWGLRNNSADFIALESLRQSSGEVTHHDAVSGILEIIYSHSFEYYHDYVPLMQALHNLGL